MVTWVRFLDRQSGQSFYFWNTHLDHEIEQARQKAGALIRQRIDAIKNDLPLILGGDFNTGQESPTHKILTDNQGLTDSWPAAAERKGKNVATFHDYKPAVEDGEHIDWILYRGGIRCQSTQVLTFNKDGQHPSDHFPVVADLRIEAPQK
jgi:endonuclease/exonuclease/phosphatase family metal-dependent hydrolase